MGRHRRRRDTGSIRAALRRMRPEPAGAQRQPEQLALLTQTSPLETHEALLADPPISAPPWRRVPAVDRPGPKADLRVVRADDQPRHAGPDIVHVPSADDVVLRYPDGRAIPVQWAADGVSAGGGRRYVAQVPPAATLTTGMVIQAGPLMVPVRLLDDLPPTWDDWYVGGGAR